MRILAWNVQDLGSAWTSDSLLTLWRQTHPTILFLSETKNPEARVKKKLKSRLQLNNFVFINPIGRSGGLGMTWINQLVGKVRLCNPFCIIVEFCYPNDNIMKVVGVYLSCDFYTRSYQLDFISNFCSQINSPFVFYGDFNATLSHSEKCSFFHPLNNNDNRSIDNFQQFVHRLALTDLFPSGPFFTWTNRQAYEVKSRLDRFLISPDWISSFPAVQFIIFRIMAPITELFS
ncbi:hypothetical protein LINGRAHAP2_LOCUS31903 [Linum grandiflorum]